MKSDIIHVTSSGIGAREALAQAEAVSAYKALSKKEAIRLRLLTEEMIGMMRALTGAHEAEFWIEDKALDFRLHLKARAVMNAEMREKLLSASTTGKNAAAKGVTGKLRNLFERMLEPIDGDSLDAYAGGWVYPEADELGVSLMATKIWSFNSYCEEMMGENAPKEEWDELEHSVLAKLADEIQIGIADGTVEMVIYKKF